MLAPRAVNSKRALWYVLNQRGFQMYMPNTMTCVKRPLHKLVLHSQTRNIVIIGMSRSVVHARRKLSALLVKMRYSISTRARTCWSQLFTYMCFEIANKNARAVICPGILILHFFLFLMDKRWWHRTPECAILVMKRSTQVRKCNYIEWNRSF